MDINTANRRQFLAGVLGTGLGVLSHATVFGKDTAKAKAKTKAKTKAPAKADEEGFITLFDGKDLTGWHTNREKIVHGLGGHWQVEDGAITGQQDPPGSGNGGVLLTDKEYGDFELKLELAPDWGIDSGVFLRTNAQGECFQVYVDYREHGNVGWISTETRSGDKRMIIRPFNIFCKKNDQDVITGFETKPDERPVAWKPDYLVYTATAEEWLATWKVGQWNELHVRCVGKYPHITTWINGKKMAEFDGTTCPQPDYDKEKVFKKLGAKGPIGLQVHGGKQLWPDNAKCRWRNIRIKPL